MARQDPAGSPASLAEARAALAEAIAAVTEFDVEIGAAVAAGELAKTYRREVRARLRALEQQPDSQDSATEAAAFIDAVRAGGAIDPEAFTSRGPSKPDQKAALEAEEAKWSLLLSASEATCEELSQRRMHAAARRDRAVAQVVRCADVAGVFLAGLEALQIEVLARRYVLSELVASKMVNDGDAERIKDVLRQLQRLPTPELRPTDLRNSEIGARWRMALEVLAVDPAAEMPTLVSILAPI